MIYLKDLENHIKYSAKYTNEDIFSKLSIMTTECVY